MALADVLKSIVNRLNFAGDDGARDTLLSEIDDLDGGEPTPAPVAAFVDDSSADDSVTDGAHA